MILLIITVHLKCDGSLKNKFNILNADISNNFSCIKQIYDLHFKEILVHIVNFNEIVPHPLIRINTKGNLHIFNNKLEKPKGYLINLRDQIPNIIIRELNKWPIFNPRAKFFFMLQNRPKPFLHLLSNYYIFNALVLQNDNFYIIKNYNYIKIGECLNGTTTIADIFNYKTPSNFQNYPLKITYSKKPPMSICPRCKKVKGIEIDIANLIFDHMGLNYRYMQTNETYWGEKNDKIYSNMYGLLQTQETNALIGFFHTKTEEHYYFDQSFSYIQASINFIVPRAKKIPQWLRIVRTLSQSVWILYFTTFIAIGFIILLISKMSGNQEKLTLKHIFTYLFQVMTDTAPTFHPITVSFKIVSTFWLLQFLIFNTALRSKLLSVLIRTEFEKQIKTIDDIAESNLIIRLDPFLKSQFVEKFNPTEAIIYEKSLTECDTTETCTVNAAFRGDTAVIKFKFEFKYYSSRILSNEQGEVLLYIIEHPVNVLHIQIYFERGHPVFDKFNNHLWNLWETGHVVSRYRVLDRKYLIAKGLADADKARLDTKPLNILQLLGIFVVWLIGLFISLIVFAVEKFTFHNERNN